MSLEMHQVNHNAELVPLNQCRKVFVHRDYTQGLTVKFLTTFPPELNGRIEAALFDKTVSDLNDMYEKAEHIGLRSSAETVLGCITCYLSQLCVTGQYEKVLKRIAAYVQQQNERIYQPRGLWLTDPIERGLRVIEITLLNEPAPERTA